MSNIKKGKIGDYTQKDIKAHAKYIKENPGCDTWGTMDGLRIPFPLIKTPHLIAIVKWIHDHPESYNKVTREKMERLLAEKVDKNSIGGVLYGANER
jgi:hypothetical protein